MFVLMVLLREFLKAFSNRHQCVQSVTTHLRHLCFSFVSEILVFHLGLNSTYLCLFVASVNL